MSFGLGTPGLTASNYILNIVELQNTVTSASGTTPLATLASQVAQLQQMVNVSTKTVLANSLSAYTSGGSITVVSPVLFSSGTTGSSSSSSGGSSLRTPSTLLTLSDGPVALSFTQRGTSTFSILSSGNALFTSSVTADSFVSPSDARLKTNVACITNYETVLSSIHGVYYDWKSSGEHDVGLIAQEVVEVLPQAVQTGQKGYLGVAYHKLIPVLVEAIKGLQARVEVLEKKSRPNATV